MCLVYTFVHFFHDLLFSTNLFSNSLILPSSLLKQLLNPTITFIILLLVLLN